MMQRSNGLIIFINLMFFQIGLLMSIMSVMIPEMIDSFHISYGMASVLPFSFYIALGLCSIPAGIAGEYFHPRKILVVTFAFALAGILIFVIFLSYWTSVFSLFVIGSSVAVIQVTAVPLLRKACGAENLAFHSTLNQLMYGAGAFFSPVIYAWLSAGLLVDKGTQNSLLQAVSSLVPAGFEWVSAYWLFVLLLIILIVIVSLLKFPGDDRNHVGSQERKAIYLELFRNKYVILYFFALVAYASCEQGIAAWMSKFFEDSHGLDPQSEGALILSYYWLMLTIGCSVGMLLLRVFESRKVLAGLTILAISSFFLALHGNTTVSKVAFPMVAAFESIMWPVILALALNSVTKHHEVLSGFMLTASLGGALGPLIVGIAGDSFGLEKALHLLFLPFLFVLSAAFWARPLVKNKTFEREAQKLA